MHRFLAALVAATLLAGCAALDLKRPVAQDDVGKLKRVAVVSRLGTTFHGVSIGTTAFNNSYFEAKVPDWKVDEFATTATVSLLRENPRLEPAALTVSPPWPEEPDGPRFFASGEPPDTVWEAATRGGFGTLIILQRGVSENNAQFRPGYGLFERSFFGHGHECVYAGYIVRVYEVASRQSIGWEWGGGHPCGPRETGKPPPFREGFEAYSTEEKAVLQRLLQERITASLRYSLETLHLLQPARS
ncbi:MAG TPA: hypothetical protein VFJ62_04405 [Usitatibacter sp.]|nr:hypothetical protein [Usitatibacter sp.]